MGGPEERSRIQSGMKVVGKIAEMYSSQSMHGPAKRQGNIMAPTAHTEIPGLSILLLLSSTVGGRFRKGHGGQGAASL